MNPPQKPPIESFIEAARAANLAAHLTAGKQLADIFSIERETHCQESLSLNRAEGKIRIAAESGRLVTDRLLEARAALLRLQSETLQGIADAVAMLQRHTATVAAWEDHQPGRELIDICRGVALDLSILNVPAGDPLPVTSPEDLASAVAPLIEKATSNGLNPAFVRDVAFLTAPE